MPQRRATDPFAATATNECPKTAFPWDILGYWGEQNKNKKQTQRLATVFYQTNSPRSKQTGVIQIIEIGTLVRKRAILLSSIGDAAYTP